MAMYEWPELLRRWGQKKLSADQAIGQLLQWGQEAAKTLIKLSAQLGRLKRLVEELVSRVEALERRLDALEGHRKRRGKSETESGRG